MAKKLATSGVFLKAVCIVIRVDIPSAAESLPVTVNSGITRTPYRYILWWSKTYFNLLGSRWTGFSEKRRKNA